MTSHIDLDSECAYLTAALASRSVLREHAIELDALSSADNRAIYRALSVTDSASIVDVIAALRASDAPASAIDLALDIGQTVVSDPAIHAKRLTDLHKRRRYAASVRRAAQLIEDGRVDDAASVLDAVRVAQRASTTKILTQRELLVVGVEAAIEIAGAVRDGASDQWPTLGLHPELDRVYRAAPGDLVIVGADPNVGKTTILQMICASLAGRRVPTALLSCEDPAVDLAVKRLSQMSNVSMNSIWHGCASGADWTRMTGAVGAAETLDDPLYTVAIEDPTVAELCAVIADLAESRGVKLVAVDYLQCVRHSEGASLRERIDATLDALIHAARKAQVILVLASQLSRPAQKQDREPGKFDLKESSTIEARAQVIVMLWRERDSDIVRAKIEKMKRGPVGARFDFERDRNGNLKAIEEAVW